MRHLLLMTLLAIPATAQGQTLEQQIEAKLEQAEWLGEDIDEAQAALETANNHGESLAQIIETFEGNHGTENLTPTLQAIYDSLQAQQTANSELQESLSATIDLLLDQMQIIIEELQELYEQQEGGE